LTSFQRHSVAWLVCDRLLLHPTTCSYGPFFAAQTLHSKCRTDVSTQLPPEALPSLRDSLLHHLSVYNDSSNHGGMNTVPIVTRLCMSTAALSVQMGWTTIIPDIMERYRPGDSNSNNNKMVLQLLQLLPEESTSDRLILLDESKRRNFHETLKTSSETIFNFLWHHANSTDNNNIVQIREGLLHCLHSWIRYIEVPPRILEQSPLLPWLFQVLQNPTINSNEIDTNGNNVQVMGNMFEISVDVVVELLRMYPSSDDSDANMGLVNKVIPLAMSLETPFRSSLKEEDEDGMRAYCRIFTEMGESYMSLILSPEDLNQVTLVELVLHCSTIPDNEIANMTLHFWYRFVSWLESLEPYEYRQYQIDRYTPQLTRLVIICTNLMRYPDDIESLMDDRIDDIQKHRDHVADTLEDSCRLLGGDLVLLKLGERLQEECQYTANVADPLSSWHGIESCLFAFRSISLYVPSDESAILPFVMTLLPQLPNVAPLRTTANLIIGKYATWLNMQPEKLQPILPYLAQGLITSPKCASAAAVAIKELCENCGKQLSLGDSVLQLYDGIVAAQQQKTGAASDGTPLLQLRDELEVLEGACKAVSRQLQDISAFGERNTQGDDDPNQETISSYVGRVVNPIGARLTEVASPENHASSKVAVTEIERLTVVVRFLHVPRMNPASTTASGGKLSARSTFLLDLMTQVWPLLDSVSKKYPRDINLAEKLCRLHKHVLRGCGSGAYQPMLEPLCAHLIQNYTQSRLSPYLYAASICITEYGRNPQFTQLLFGMLSDMCSVTFEFLRTIDDFTAHPDVVEEFFFLAGRMMTYCPEPLVLSPLLHSLLQCAIVGIKIDHKDANRGTLNFLENMVAYGLNLNVNPNDLNKLSYRESMERSIVAEGQQLATNLVQALVGNLPAYRIDNSSGSIASILYKLNQLCPSLLMQWVNPAISIVPEPIRKPFLFALSIQSTRSRDEFYSSVRKLSKDCEHSRKLNI